MSVLFDAFDVSSNKSTMKFKIKITEGTTNADESLVSDISYLVPSESMRVTGHNCSVDFGKGTVYEPMRIDDKSIDRKVGVAKDPVHFRLQVVRSISSWVAAWAIQKSPMEGNACWVAHWLG